MAGAYFAACLEQRKDTLPLTTVQDGCIGAANTDRQSKGYAPDVIDEALSLFEGVAAKYELNLDHHHGIELEAAVEPVGEAHHPEKCGWWDPQCTLRGRMDKTEFDGETFTVIDWTTAFNMDKSEQLADYGILAYAMVPEAQNVRLETHYVRYGQSIIEDFSRDDARAAWERHVRCFSQVEKKLLRVEEGEHPGALFTAAPGPLCAYCKLECPARDPQRAPLEYGPEDIQTVAAAWIALSSKVKQMEAMLRGHVSVNGPIEGNNFSLAFVPTETAKYDATEVRRAIYAVDPSLLDMLKFSVTKSSVEKLLKQSDMAKAALAGVEPVVTPGTRWTVKGR
jgi:hypothetical protein